MKTMLDYINEEQAALIQILNQFQLTDTDVSKVTHCLILATGSSHNACQAAKVYLEEWRLFMWKSKSRSILLIMAKWMIGLIWS